MLTKEKVQKYKDRLQKEKEKLLAEVKTDASMLDFGDDVDSGDEEADETEEKGNKLAVEQVLKKRVAEIDFALERIKRGTYGVCEMCGGEISENVLDAAPESNLCEKCKKGRG